jgi:hypothetical protein
MSGYGRHSMVRNLPGTGNTRMYQFQPQKAAIMKTKGVEDRVDWLVCRWSGEGLLPTGRVTTVLSLVWRCHNAVGWQSYRGRWGWEIVDSVECRRRIAVIGKKLSTGTAPQAETACSIPSFFQGGAWETGYSDKILILN